MTAFETCLLRLVAVACAVCAPLAQAAQATAESFPNRPVRIVVPFPPGGSNDIVARAFGQRLQERWAQSVVIDNRGGAGGAIGSELAARSQPNGYTLVIGAVSTMAANVSLYKLGFDPLRDLTPLAKVASGAFVLVTYAGLPVNSARELIALARAKPGSLNYGSSGSGSSLHLVAELFKSKASIDIVHVPYKGGGPAVTDLVAGQVAIIFTDMAPVGGHVKAGRLKALAQTTAKRTAPLPDLPTLNESALPGYVAEAWYGFLAPAGVPAPLVRFLNAELNAVASSPEMQSRLVGLGIESATSTPEEFRALIRSEIAKWAEVVRVSGARVD
jgi:tripartite-type tricarboxylate transporter receptor subunit TctC